MITIDLWQVSSPRLCKAENWWSPAMQGQFIRGAAAVPTGEIASWSAIPDGAAASGGEGVLSTQARTGGQWRIG
jgi:hypothetical protein